VTDPPRLPAVASAWPGRLLGVDAGGSGTQAVVLEAGQVTAQPDGPPMNALLTSGFTEQLLRIIATAGPTAAGIGLPGVHAAGQASQLGQTLTRRAGRPVHVTGDAGTARHGAFLGAPGIVVIAGTGSVALGWDGERFAYAGGHGYLLGDEGSAHWSRARPRSAADRPLRRRASRHLGRVRPAPAPGPARGRLRRGLPRPGHLGALRRPDRSHPPARPARGRRRPAGRHLHVGVAEPFMFVSRSPGILERVTAWLAKIAPRRTRIASAAVLAGVLCGAAACSSSPPGPAGASASPAATRAAAAATRTVPTGTATSAVPQGPPHVTVSYIRTADGSLVTVASLRGPVQYVLHNGSQDPGPAYAGLVRAGPAVAGAERRRLLAAFNGGFLLRSRAGGYEQEGHVFRSLRHGLASLVIDRSGRARIGVWGVDVPVPGEAVYSVRQNLWLLVQDGRPTAEAARWYRWGGTVGHAEYVARSALGQDAAGDLIYAASMSATPQDLAQALARSGARIAMELDINSEWVQLAIARAPGGPLRAPVPGQVRPSTQYLTGWTRDFITVLAAR
jgi:hypothetical protein